MVRARGICRFHASVSLQRSRAHGREFPRAEEVTENVTREHGSKHLEGQSTKPIVQYLERNHTVDRGVGSLWSLVEIALMKYCF